MPQIVDYAALTQPAPTDWPRTVVGLLLNDPQLLASLGDKANQPPYKAPPKAPVLYVKPANTYARSGQDIILPDDVEQVQIGACLGIQIGRTATRLTRDNALDHVAGYRLVADLTIPHESFYRPAIKQKCRDGFCPIGELLPRDRVGNPDDVTIAVSIDGQPAWHTSTAGRVRDVRQALVDVTDFMTLQPGDLLLLGIPAAPPVAAAGQSYRVSAEGFTDINNALCRA